MTKPWERDLGVHPLDARVVVDEEGLVVADVREPLSGDGRGFAVLFAAAPDMARALAAFVVQAKDSDLRFIAPGPLALANAALKKARVIP